MKTFKWLLGLMMITLVANDGPAQQPQRDAKAAPTRYFQLMLVLRFPASTTTEPRTQTLTTDIAVHQDRPGASNSKTRVLAQVPIVSGKQLKYIDLGTQFDCNDVHIEGNGLALAIVLETSSVTGIVTTKDRDGQTIQEPIISRRTLSLSAKLPLNTPKVIWDSKDADSSKLTFRAIGTETDKHKADVVPQPPTMQVEMTATELE